MYENFYFEFIQALDLMLTNYLDCIRKKDKSLLMLGIHSVEIPLMTFLSDSYCFCKDEYNQWRNDGLSSLEAFERLSKQVGLEYNTPEESRIADTTTLPLDITSYPCYKALSQYKEQLLIYISSKKQLVYLTPFIKNINQPVFILSEYDIPKDTDLPDNVTAITFDIIDIRLFTNDFLESKYPQFFHTFSSFALLVNILNPKGIILVDGCHYQEQILAVIGSSYHITTICIQQDWPLFLNNGFRELPYDHYLTWGRDISNFMKAFNPETMFHPTGCFCPFNYAQKKVQNCITFFLQTPLSLSDCAYNNELPNLITQTALNYPQHTLLVRECPGFNIQDEILEYWFSLPNIKVVANMPLSMVFEVTLVSVSQFSSTLMEGLYYHCIPLVYSSLDASLYHLNFEKEGLGMIAKNEEEFYCKLEMLLNAPSHFLSEIESRKKEIFENVSTVAVRNAVQVIAHILSNPYFSQVETPCLQIGCGPYPIKGWLNTDIEPVRGATFMDASKPFPFPDDSFNYIFSEHLFEHLTASDGLFMLQECNRVMKMNGVIRLAMPDLGFLIRLYENPETDIHKKYIDWCIHRYLPEVELLYPDGGSPAMYILNNFYRAWGHQTIYDKKGIFDLLSKCGFKDINFFKPGESNIDIFKGIEKHSLSIPKWANDLESFVIEGWK